MSELNITEFDGQLVVDSRLIAVRLNIEHESFIKTVKKYQTKIEQRFGVVRFDFDKPLKGSRGGRPEQFAYLTEPQATTLMTFSQNTDEVVDLTLDLVESFENAKQKIKQLEKPTPAPSPKYQLPEGSPILCLSKRLGGDLSNFDSFFLPVELLESLGRTIKGNGRDNSGEGVYYVNWFKFWDEKDSAIALQAFNKFANRHEYYHSFNPNAKYEDKLLMDLYRVFDSIQDKMHFAAQEPSSFSPKQLQHYLNRLAMAESNPSILDKFKVLVTDHSKKKVTQFKIREFLESK